MAIVKPSLAAKMLSDGRRAVLRHDQEQSASADRRLRRRKINEHKTRGAISEPSVTRMMTCRSSRVPAPL